MDIKKGSLQMAKNPLIRNLRLIYELRLEESVLST